MKNNKVMYSGKLFFWNYNAATMMLATDIKSKNNNKITCQWNLNVISEYSWTAFYFETLLLQVVRRVMPGP